MTRPFAIPTLPVPTTAQDRQAPSALPPTLHAEARKNGWELITPAGKTLALEHVGDDPSLNHDTHIRVALLATHPSAASHASPIEIMAAKHAAMIIFAKKPDTYSQIMELGARYLSGVESDIYYAVEFFDRDNKLCHNAIVTATEAMPLLERMNASVPEEHRISMTITSRVNSSEAWELTPEQRGLPDPSE